MIDIKWLRDNASLYDASLTKRGAKPLSQELLHFADTVKEENQKLEALLQQRNTLAKSPLSLEEKKLRAQEIKSAIHELQEEVHKLNAELKGRLLMLPNIVHEHTPEGANAEQNVLVSASAPPAPQSFTPLHHSQLTDFGIDDTAGVALSGSRFSVLRRQAARLENALQRFMIDEHIKAGYELVSTPVVVNEQTLINTGQLPKFAHDLFQTTHNHWLIPTAEATVTSLFANTTVDPNEFPIKMTALTNCFRAEAGAAGKQTKGLIRQHQFSKVELVQITRPEDGEEALESMTQQAESILQKLELPYKKMLLCSGDLGFSAQKTYDLEVWMASLQSFVEISSCSLCGSFQAQRMGMKLPNKQGYPVTLNGSGLAIGRTIAAISEHYQQQDGSVVVPAILKPYM